MDHRPFSFHPIKRCYQIYNTDSIGRVKQLITRLDDELHARLKARAAEEGRSLNDLIVEALSALVSKPLTRSEFREQLRRTGRLVEFNDVVRPDPKIVRAAWASGGRAVIEALEAERAKGW